VKIGLRPTVWLTPGQNPFAIQIDLSIEAERLGFDGIFFGDRMLASVGHGGVAVYESTHTDLLVTLTAVASRTSRVNVGSLVLVAPFRHPVPLAKSIASLDLLSNGRVIFPLGAGWNQAEFAALGLERREAAARLCESIELMRELWTGNTVSYSGKYYQADNIRLEPRPVQAGGPPIWLGSFLPARQEEEGFLESPRWRRSFQRVGQFADGWVPLLYSQFVKRSVSPRVLAAAWGQIQTDAVAAGRTDAVTFAFSHWFYVIENADDEQAARQDLAKFFVGTFDDARETYLIGTAEEIVAKIAHLTSEIVSPEWVIFSMLGPHRRQLDLLHSKVLPLLAATPLGSR